MDKRTDSPLPVTTAGANEPIPSPVGMSLEEIQRSGHNVVVEALAITDEAARVRHLLTWLTEMVVAGNVDADRQVRRILGLIPTAMELKDRGQAMSEPVSDTQIDQFNGPSDYVLLPAGCIVHQDGIPVLLMTGALVHVAHGNMAMLVGHHLCAAPRPPE